jgi:hypothetical protein
MTDDGRRTIDEKFVVQAFLAGEAAVGEAAVAEDTVDDAATVETVLGAGLIDRAVRVERGMGVT